MRKTGRLDDDLTPEEVQCVEDFYSGKLEVVRFETTEEAIARLHGDE